LALHISAKMRTLITAEPPPTGAAGRVIGMSVPLSVGCTARSLDRRP
jgi:hypothetical protein